MIKNIRTIRNRNNTKGIFSIKDQKFFYKILDLNDYEKELNGYKIVRGLYPVAILVFHGMINNKKNGLLIYKYERTVEKDHGLLIDILANKKSYVEDIDAYDIILNLYKEAFYKSFKQTISQSSDVFFKDRLETRVKQYYNRAFIEDTVNINFTFKNRNINQINFKEILSSLEKFFSNKSIEYCVISQCDPNDLNIGTKPVIFDYLGGGYNPLMAEFAVLFWYCIAQGSYFSVAYNKNEYIDHPAIVKKLDKVSLNRGKLKHHTNLKRKIFLINYIKVVVNPLLEKVPENYDWYEDFKNYLAMRIISVFDVSKMNKKDRLLSLAYLDIFYNQLKVKKTSQLIEIIKEL